MSSPYTPAGQRVYDEAIRTIPGLLAAKERRSPKDAAVLFDGYMEVAQANGLSQQESWSILFNASIHWSHQLIRNIAAKGGRRSALEIAETMCELAAGWVS